MSPRAALPLWGCMPAANVAAFESEPDRERIAPDQSWLRSEICEATSRACEAMLGTNLEAIILTGSVARDEGTYLYDEKNGWTALGDAEFVLVFRESVKLPGPSSLDLVRQESERWLRDRRINCRVGLSAVRPTYFRKLPPHIYAYELRTCGRVVWGNSAILSLIPEFSPAEIPLEDGWRLLCNRVVELLAVTGQHVYPERAISPLGQYQIVKLYLDMATSFLLFIGAYAPTYSERSRRLLAFTADEGATNGISLSLRSFATHVAQSTEWKLSPTVAAECNPRELLHASVSYARELWGWEMQRMIGKDSKSGTEVLLERWMQSQSMHDRLRGWAFVLRKCGWHQSWREWPRWIRLSRKASPRYLVYAAGCTLFFCLPSLLRNEFDSRYDDSCSRWEQLARWLPRCEERAAGDIPSWRWLGDEVARNYREFLTETRA